LAKLACGITDTSVTMACKAHWRNGRPVVLAVATNDALSANWQNIGRLAVRRNTYFVPFRQDDPAGKATSLAADLPQLLPTLRAALEGRQLQPVLGASD
jgi:dipicolinate synthase subunit B